MTEKSFARMEVEFPDEEELRTRTDAILDAALPQRSLAERLKKIYFGAGPKTVFYHCGEAWLLMLFLYAGLCLFCWKAGNHAETQFAISALAFPLCYLTFWFVCCWLEEQEEVVELKNTMHYTLPYIMSLRMFYSSILSIFLNLFLLSVVDGCRGQTMWKLMAAGVSSIFLFAVVALYLYQRWGRGIYIGILLLFWFAVTVVMVQFQSEMFNRLNEKLPLAVHIAAALGSLLLFVLYLRKVERENAYSVAC